MTAVAVPAISPRARRRRLLLARFLRRKVGVGCLVIITFFVVAEGRYKPSNFPSFVLDPSKLVWDFNTESSNYSTLRQQAFTARSGAVAPSSSLPIWIPRPGHSEAPEPSTAGAAS